MSRLAISNIAWRSDERLAVYSLLAEHDVTGLEIAPGLTFPGTDDPFSPSTAEVRRFRAECEGNGLSPVSMQSLLFGSQGASLFGSPAERAAFETGIERAIALGARLETPNLVLGSPTNRVIPPNMVRGDAEAIACEVLGRLGQSAQAAGVTLALEPNPVDYGTNFLNTMAETLAFANRVDHPAITVNFDLGALHINGEFPLAASLFRQGLRRISHVHISEPHLAPAPASAAGVMALASVAMGIGYPGWFSIEMRPYGEDNVENVRVCVRACLQALKTGTLR